MPTQRGSGEFHQMSYSNTSLLGPLGAWGVTPRNWRAREQEFSQRISGATRVFDRPVHEAVSAPRASLNGGPDEHFAFGEGYARLGARSRLERKHSRFPVNA